jgi:excisionase family DNA binding protein
MLSTTTHRRETGTLSRERLEALVTVDELSSLLKTSKPTIYTWCHHRSIPYYQLGRRSLFDPVEVIAWLEAKRVEPVR